MDRKILIAVVGVLILSGIGFYLYNDYHTHRLAKLMEKYAREEQYLVSSGVPPYWIGNVDDYAEVRFGNNAKDDRYEVQTLSFVSQKTPDELKIAFKAVFEKEAGWRENPQQDPAIISFVTDLGQSVFIDFEVEEKDKTKVTLKRLIAL